MCFANATRVRRRPYPKGRKMPEDWKMGERSATRKLTWLQASEIRCARRGYGQTKALAERFGISRSHVRAIWRGEYWTFDRRPA